MIVFAILAVLWTFAMFFTGVGIGASDKLIPLIQNKVRPPKPALPEQNRCQCGHMRSFHGISDGCTGHVQGQTTPGGNSMLCTCQRYISSLVTEVTSDVHHALPDVDIPTPKNKALEA